MRHMPAARLGLWLVIVTGIAFGQAFEVASIRPSGPKSTREATVAPAAGIRPGIHSAGRGPDDLILIAYHVEMFQISSETAAGPG